MIMASRSAPRLGPGSAGSAGSAGRRSNCAKTAAWLWSTSLVAVSNVRVRPPPRGHAAGRVPPLRPGELTQVSLAELVEPGGIVPVPGA